MPKTSKIPESADCTIAEPTLRRSQRQRKPAEKDNNFLTGSAYKEELNNLGPQENDHFSSRRHKNYWGDDSEDFEEGKKRYRKRLFNESQIQGLLQWQQQLEPLDLTIDGLLYPSQTKQFALPYQHFSSKNIYNENLEKFGKNIQALYLNLDWSSKIHSIKKLAQLQFESKKLMSKGLVFIWIDKRYLLEVLEIMEQKKFIYVQNLQVAKFDVTAIMGKKVEKKLKNEQLRDAVKSLKAVDPVDYLTAEESQVFQKSKETLYLFKKNVDAKIELRHQRTCDVVFDLPSCSQQRFSEELKDYIYKMIEILLPECLALKSNKNQVNLKMMELFGPPKQERRGWINVTQS